MNLGQWPCLYRCVYNRLLAKQVMAKFLCEHQPLECIVCLYVFTIKFNCKCFQHTFFFCFASEMGNYCRIRVRRCQHLSLGPHDVLWSPSFLLHLSCKGRINSFQLQHFTFWEIYVNTNIRNALTLRHPFSPGHFPDSYTVWPSPASAFLSHATFPLSFPMVQSHHHLSVPKGFAVLLSGMFFQWPGSFPPYNSNSNVTSSEMSFQITPSKGDTSHNHTKIYM